VYPITNSVNNQFEAQFFFLYLFIPVLYMFRATLCSSSEESIVSIRPLVYVTVLGDRAVCRFRWNYVPSKPAYHTVTYIELHIPEVVLIQLTLLMMSTRLLETCRELINVECVCVCVYSSNTTIFIGRI